MIDLDEIERKAKAATESPWVALAYGDRGDRATVCHTGDGATVFADRPSYEFHGTPENDAAFIAATDPQTVIALVCAVRAAMDTTDECGFDISMGGVICNFCLSRAQSQRDIKHTPSCPYPKLNAALAPFKEEA